MVKKTLRAQLKDETKPLKEQIATLIAEKEAELIKNASLADKVIYFFEDMPRSDVEEAMFRGYCNAAVTNKIKARLAPHNITYFLADELGGDEEEDGNVYWKVYSFSDGKEQCHIKFDGYYSSYDGSEMRSFFVVAPVTKQITVFEKV
jgi:hypothetical protein